MALVVFLRAVNVGGRTVHTREIADTLDLVNIGAAGTFVALRGDDTRKLERAIRRALPFETEMMICPGAEIVALMRSEPFGKRAPPAGVKRSLTVLSRAPDAPPPLPIEKPAGKTWEVQVTRIDGRYALSLRRRLGPRLIYPNEVIEKQLGVPGTTRGWETVEAICRVLSWR